MSVSGGMIWRRACACSGTLSVGITDVVVAVVAAVDEADGG